jgi:hypothetical protein
MGVYIAVGNPHKLSLNYELDRQDASRGLNHEGLWYDTHGTIYRR